MYDNEVVLMITQRYLRDMQAYNLKSGYFYTWWK